MFALLLGVGTMALCISSNLISTAYQHQQETDTAPDRISTTYQHWQETGRPDICSRACMRKGGDDWASNTELTETCIRAIQARQIKPETLATMAFSAKGNGLLPIDFGDWKHGIGGVEEILAHFEPPSLLHDNVTWDDIISSTSAAAALQSGGLQRTSPQQKSVWTPPCVMGTHVGGSDGIGMNIERTLVGSVIGTLLGCRTKCAPIRGRVRHSVVYAHHADGTTTYCHHSGWQNGLGIKAEKKAVLEYTKSHLSFNGERQQENTKSHLPKLPSTWMKNMRCYNISNFQSQLSEIVPCWSAELATTLPDATFLDPAGGTSLYVLDHLFEVPRNTQNQAMWNDRVAEARKLIVTVRQRQHHRHQREQSHSGNNTPVCTFGGPTKLPPAGRTAVSIAVHVRNGDVKDPTMTKFQLCFVRRVYGVLHDAGLEAHIHIYSETHRAGPMASNKLEGSAPPIGVLSGRQLC